VIVLSIDTCLNACSAAVVRDGAVLSARVEPMSRGHQERLGGLVAEVMAEAHAAFADLDRVGVTTGPGSFTGLRVGLAFAKGVASALSIPCIGVGSLDALAAEAPGLAAAVVDAKHGQAYWRLFRDGTALTEPAVGGLADAASVVGGHAGGGAVALFGSGAALAAVHLPGASVHDAAFPDPAAVARLASRSQAPAAPLYLRPPYAALPA
jgi:tRNA threonylcarbamoyladenosine biosynthesis protein TsaB